MEKAIKKTLFNQRGVTLIELIAVILILGIIAAVGIPVVFNQIQNSKVQADAANIAIINDAIERYAVMNGGYPIVATANINTLISTLNSPTAAGAPFIRNFPTTKSSGGNWILYDDGGSVASDGDRIAEIR